ncbi:MAG: low molecular weight phosphotyrosine protein phosphatase [Bacteroidales bacterium]|nr:low molecular weight phosphotyrosine protein phosphatase [Bacteroidales bacterium]
MKILFVCLGNICRSPLAAGILRKKIDERNLDVEVESAGFEPHHIGQEAEQRTIDIAKAHGVDIIKHGMRMFSAEDFDTFDRIYVMDQKNYRDVTEMARNEEDMKKVDFLLNVIEPGVNKIIADPYYGTSADFEKVFLKLDKACEIIANSIEQQKRATT